MKSHLSIIQNLINGVEEGNEAEIKRLNQIIDKTFNNLIADPRRIFNLTCEDSLDIFHNISLSTYNFIYEHDEWDVSDLQSFMFNISVISSKEIELYIRNFYGLNKSSFDYHMANIDNFHNILDTECNNGESKNRNSTDEFSIELDNYLNGLCFEIKIDGACSLFGIDTVEPLTIKQIVTNVKDDYNTIRRQRFNLNFFDETNSKILVNRFFNSL